MDDDSALTSRMPVGRVIVVCGREDDAHAWRQFIGPTRCDVLALDTAPRHGRTVVGASGQLAWQHDTIAGLDGSGWLARDAAAFDPAGSATLIIPDPFDPPRWGTRRRIGPRHPAWRLVEDKTVVDTLWDALGLPRARSIVADHVHVDSTLATLGAMVDNGTGVVCSRQPIGTGPTAGGDDIWWWHDGRSPPPGLTEEPGPGRLRLMPLLEGLPVRLHGLVLEHGVIVFPPLEVVTLPRPDQGTFMCTGTARTLSEDDDLVELTERVGAGVREHLGYRGGFSVDGIHAEDGFWPTDFNGRLTSAMDAAPPALRVRLHTANLLVREGTEPEADAIERLAEQVFASRGRHTLYGAAHRVRDSEPRTVTAFWENGTLVGADDEDGDVVLAVSQSPRGWLLTASLISDRLPRGAIMGLIAPAVFRFSDEALGTDFGQVTPPFGLRPGLVPSPHRRVDSAEPVQRGR